MFVKRWCVFLCFVTLLVGCSQNPVKARASLLANAHSVKPLTLSKGLHLSSNQIKTLYPTPAVNLSAASQAPSLIPPGSNIENLSKNIKKKK